MSKLEQLKNGECALHNTGTVEELNRVLDFVKTRSDTRRSTGCKTYYNAIQCVHGICWEGVDFTNLKYYPTSELIAELDAMEEEENKEEAILDMVNEVAELEKENEELKAYNEKATKVIQNTRKEYKRLVIQNSELREKLSELQPFERGVYGWYCENKAWSIDKASYVTKLNFGHLIALDGVFLKVDDFTTENPHKKGTVFIEPDTINDFDRRLEFTEKVLLQFLDSDDKSYTLHFMDSRTHSCLYITQLGDDLKAKFDDPNNKKYIDLTK